MFSSSKILTTTFHNRDAQAKAATHRKIEDVLIESKLLNQALLSSLPAHISVLDRDGNIIAVNKAWERFNRENAPPGFASFNGCSASYGINYLAVCESAEGERSKDACEALAGIRAVLRHERDEFTMEYPCHSPDARQWFLLSATPLPEEIGGAVVLRLNITTHVLAEEERARLLEREQEAHARAEEVIRLKDEFLATASHELRAPLHAIMGWTKLLRAGTLSPEEADRALETVERAALAQSQIVSDLLDMSRVITGKLKLNVRPFDPLPAIKAAVDTVRPAAAAKGVSIEMNFGALAGEIAGDPDRLQQIVWNIVSNAVKFTPRGGKVSLSAGRSGPGFEDIEIVVQDTGAGIKPEFLPCVFDPFRQADGSRTRKYSGLGLGLAIVRRLVELHGGSVLAESPGENQGATFTVRLPVNSKCNLAGSAVEASSQPDDSIRDQDMELERIPNLEGTKILVVDDEPDCATLTSYLLSQWGADVKTVISAADALDVFERQQDWRPDILISDIQMPGIDGYTLMRRVRELESHRGGNIPAIALTAHTRAEDRIRALAAGFQIHVAKPIEPIELLTVVESLTNRPIRPL